MSITIEIQPFNFPNYLRFDGFRLAGGEREPMIPVGALTDEQAADYWNSMKTHWLAHVATRRDQESA